MILLAADVGGTNARVALFERGDSEPRVLEQYRTAAWDGVPSLLGEFLATHTTDLTGACVPVAGPEQIGPTGELLGNLPQAFTHLALISAAVNLHRQLHGRPS